MSDIDVYIINYGVFFFCTWLGYKVGSSVFKKKGSKALGWASGLVVWLGSMVPFAFFIPPLPN